MRAAEALVDEDGDRGRAGALEGGGERGRLGVRPEVARRGRAALDLRDRREPGPRERVTKPAHQQPPGRKCRDPHRVVVHPHPSA